MPYSPKGNPLVDEAEQELHRAGQGAQVPLATWSQISAPILESLCASLPAVTQSLHGLDEERKTFSNTLTSCLCNA